MTSPIGVSILGLGIVGGGTVELLNRRSDSIAKRLGRPVEIRHVVVRDPAKARDIQLPSGVVHTDALKAIDDPAVSVVVELIGGHDPARQYIERALSKGKSIVTANKSLLAAHGPELFAAARKHGQCIAFEASCAGGIPIIDALTRGLSANAIRGLVGIVNGTCNFILSKMTKENLSYAQALKGAQDAGFAEADPTLDVSGRDAAQKLAILSSLAFSQQVAEADVICTGIDTLDAREITFAGELGYVIKLLASGWKDAGSGKLSLTVTPTLVRKSDVLADVSGGFNAVSVWGDAVGHTLFYGRGAGSLPTASSVVSDIISVASGSAKLHFDTSRVWPDLTPRAQTLAPEASVHRFYLRLTAVDRPGVLARVTDLLGKHSISLGAILQQESASETMVPVVITTHQAKRGDMLAALKQIDALDVIGAKTVCLPILGTV
jgi:homoserine dehydrogenase